MHVLFKSDNFWATYAWTTSRVGVWRLNVNRSTVICDLPSSAESTDFDGGQVTGLHGICRREFRAKTTDNPAWSEPGSRGGDTGAMYGLW